RRRLVRALAQLPERQRAVYVAIARDGLTYDALAERFGVGVDEIERDFAAALATLAEAIDAPAVPWRRRFIRWISRKASK
ncbi:MAG: sigma factor-like helix-turn-helix DNA-binding protein, partial [Sphingomonas sp.]